MDNFRSMSVREGGKQPPSSMHDLRSFSTSYATNNNSVIEQKEVKLKKSKSKSAYSSKNWSLSDPEIQRKKRVATYKVYGVEGKMKGSIRKSLRCLYSYGIFFLSKVDMQ
ncbi:hypothetical protein Leryth_011408 [Lithospermum erythrorhizon]|nr:hypothetical protein Leryth_011408 [Lithospermum erythrorhizon]